MMAQPRDDEREQRAARLADAVTRRGQSRQGPPQRVHRIHAPDVDVAGVARGLAAWYQLRLLRTQILAEQPGLCIVQCTSAPWRQAAGRAFELTVELRRDESDLHVGIGWAWLGRAGIPIGATWPGRLGIPVTTLRLPESPASAAWRAMEQQRLSDQSLAYIRSLLWRQRVRGSWQTGVLRGPPMASRSRPGQALEPERAPTASAEAAGRPEAAPTIEPSPVTSAERIAGSAAERGRQAEHQASAPFSPAAEPIDINAATLDELMGLPGMDRVKAEKVLAARAARGGFTGVQAMVDAAELKPHELVQLRPRLTVGKAPRGGTAQTSTGHAGDHLSGPGRVIDV